MGFWAGLFGDRVEEETLATTLGEEARWHRRFRGCRRTATVWRLPTVEDDILARYPILAPYGDFDVALTERDEQFWLVRERIWFGFPDPPQFVFFAFQSGELWCAADFDAWPRRWQRPLDQPKPAG